MKTRTNNISQKWTVLEVSGRIDAFSAAALEKACQVVLSNSPKGFALDLSDVTFISSAGLRVLVSCFEKQTQNGAAFAVVTTHENVVETITVAGLAARFAVCSDLASLPGRKVLSFPMAERLAA
jgi:anti-sigma B factor antagonist